jgi:transposase
VQEGALLPLASVTGRKEEPIQQARRAERQNQYEQVVSLYKQGVSQRQIAQRMRLSVRIIGRWLQQGCAPGSREAT